MKAVFHYDENGSGEQGSRREYFSEIPKIIETHGLYLIMLSRSFWKDMAGY